MKKITISLFVIIFFMMFFYGISVGLYEIFPYQFLNLVKDTIFADNSRSQQDLFDKIVTHFIIDIDNESDILKKREALIHFIWKTESIPSSYPDIIEKNIFDERYSDIDNLKQIDKFTITMKHKVNSIVYLFHPKQSNDHLILYHQGHAGDFINGKQSIDYFLKNGYYVVAFSMPLLGMNEQPIIEIENLGVVKLFNHDQLQYLESENFTSISYFLTPIAYTLNYLDDHYNFKTYSMVGLSGGGWASTIYPAIDTRISKSFAVAGSLPISLRLNAQDIGDYEQLHFELYKIANYPELYIMSSYGNDREFVQIFNKYDTCCFAGTLYEHYEYEIKKVVSNLNNGKFSVILDDTHNEHKISGHTLKLVHENISLDN